MSFDKAMQKALEADGEKLRQLTGEDHGPDFLQDDDCPNCGGEGVVYSCQDEIGCIDPESGCDLCERRCDWCRPRKPSPQANVDVGS
jgi:hypothetical protein